MNKSELVINLTKLDEITKCASDNQVIGRDDVLWLCDMLRRRQMPWILKYQDGFHSGLLIGTVLSGLVFLALTIGTP